MVQRLELQFLFAMELTPVNVRKPARSSNIDIEELLREPRKEMKITQLNKLKMLRTLKTINWLYFKDNIMLRF